MHASTYAPLGRPLQLLGDARIAVPVRLPAHGWYLGRGVTLCQDGILPCQLCVMVLGRALHTIPACSLLLVGLPKRIGVEVPDERAPWGVEGLGVSMALGVLHLWREATLP